MCRFLSLDFEYNLKCPVDKQTTRSDFRPSHSCVDMRWMWSSVTRSLKSTSSPAAKHAVGCLSPASTGKGSIRSQRLSPTVNDRPPVESASAR